MALKEIKKKNQKRKKIKPFMIAVYVFIFLFTVVSVYTLVKLQMEITTRKNQLNELDNQILVQEIKNKEISDICNFTEDEFLEYVAQLAQNEYDYVKPGVRVFVTDSGD